MTLRNLTENTMTICNLPQAEIKLNIRAYINRNHLKEAIATQYPLVKLSDRELDELLIKCLEGSFHDKLPEDIDWRIQKDPYFQSFREKLAEAQLNAEELIDDSEELYQIPLAA
jgi:hypothetical protein